MPTLHVYNAHQPLPQKDDSTACFFEPLSQLDQLSTLVENDVDHVRIDINATILNDLSAIFTALCGSKVKTLSLIHSMRQAYANLNEFLPQFTIESDAIAQSPLTTLNLQGAFNEAHLRQLLPGIHRSQIQNLSFTGDSLKEFNDILATFKPGRLNTVTWNNSLPIQILKPLEDSEVCRFFAEVKRLRLTVAGIPLHLKGASLIRALSILEDSSLNTLYVPKLLEEDPQILKAAVAKLPIGCVTNFAKSTEYIPPFINSLQGLVEQQVKRKGRSFRTRVKDKYQPGFYELPADVILLLSNYLAGTSQKEVQHFYRGFFSYRTPPLPMTLPTSKALVRQRGSRKLQDLAQSVADMSLEEKDKTRPRQ